MIRKLSPVQTVRAVYKFCFVVGKPNDLSPDYERKTHVNSTVNISKYSKEKKNTDSPCISVLNFETVTL